MEQATELLAWTLLPFVALLLAIALVPPAALWSFFGYMVYSVGILAPCS